MKSRLFLVASLGAALALAVMGPARADHDEGHDHPYCAQGGDGTTGGEGGTQFDGAAANHFGGGGGGDPADRTVLIPTHLGARFGEDDPGLDPNAQFIEIEADDIEGIGGDGASGGPYHGGHGGGPGGGQGGSTFLGGGDGGCTPYTFETVDRPVGPPHRHLPRTGSLTEQLALLSGLMLSLGGLLWMVGRRRTDVAPAAATPEAAGPVVVTPVWGPGGDRG